MKLAQMNSKHLWNVRHDRHFFCVKCTPTKETVFAQHLHNRGVDIFIPVNIRWRRANKTTREKKRVPFVAFPGYVLIGQKEPVFPWLAVYELPHFQGVLGHGGIPKTIDIEQTSKFLGAFREGMEADKVEKHMPTNMEYKVGDMVEVLETQFQGQVIEVKSIQGSKVKGVLNLFGGERETTFKAHQLGKVA